MKYIKIFEIFENKLTIDYLKVNHPIELDKYYLSSFGIERFFIMIDDKPSYYTEEYGFNDTKNYLYRILKKDGMILDERVDVPVIKKYLKSVFKKNNLGPK